MRRCASGKKLLMLQTQESNGIEDSDYQHGGGRSTQNNFRACTSQDERVERRNAAGLVEKESFGKMEGSAAGGEAMADVAGVRKLERKG